MGCISRFIPCRLPVQDQKYEQYKQKTGGWEITVRELQAGEFHGGSLNPFHRHQPIYMQAEH